MIFRKKRIKELENTVASLVRTVETLQGRIEDFEESLDNLLKPVLEAFEKMENSASTEKENKNELDYKGVIDEWLNGSPTVQISRM